MNALAQKALFKLPQLLVEQIVCLVDQADQRVGGCFMVLLQRRFEVFDDLQSYNIGIGEVVAGFENVNFKVSDPELSNENSRKVK